MGAATLARFFYGSVAGGVLLSVLAAGVYPMPESQRYRSSISVVPDGGREETFVIEWHQDRVQPLVGAQQGPLQVAGGMVVLPGDGAAAAAAEVFRLRDVAGNVVGLASRTTAPRAAADGGTGSVSEWVLLLPSRGTLFLTQVNARDVAPRPGPAPDTLVPAADAGGFWSDGTRLRITAGPADGGAGRVNGGTEEFAGLSGSYDETWELEQVAANGESRGRITLTTRVQAAP